MGTSRRTGRGIVVTVLAALAALHRAPPSTAGAGDLDAWSPESRPALDLYLAERYAEAQQWAVRAAATAIGPEVRADFDAIRAMCLLRGESRSDREAGRNELLGLAAARPEIIERPECLLALGVGLTALHETAAALLQLHTAAERLDSADLRERAAAARVALINAWAVHGEWEVPVPGVIESRPANAAAMEATRLERMRALRAEAESRGAPADALDRMDVILARYLLARVDSQDAATALLRDIAQRPRRNRATGEACLILAETLESQGQFDEALDLYARVASAEVGELSEAARRRRDAVLRPALELAEVAGPADQPARVSFTARNVRAVRVEVRRIDLPSWLERNQGRLNDAQLPATGALVATRDYRGDATVHAAWQPPADQATFELPAGAYVVIATADSSGGQTLTAQQLVVIGALEASVIVGRERALAWIRDAREGAQASPRSARLRFWQSGAFVPRSAEFRDGLAWLTLGGESRVLRDRRWVALIESDDALALCRGELPGPEKDVPPAAMLSVTPTEIDADGVLHVAGMLVRTEAQTQATRSALSLQVLDALGRARGGAELTPDASGFFATSLPLEQAAGGDKLRVVLRSDRQVVPVFGSVPMISVADGEPGALNLKLEALPMARAGADAIRTAVSAYFSDGTPLAAGSRLRYWARGVRLPITGLRETHWASNALDGHGALDAAGETQIVTPLALIGADQPPAAVGVWAMASPPDGRAQIAFSERLLGDELAHLWVQSRSKSAAPGDVLRFRVGWFDPQHLADCETPLLAIVPAQGEATTLVLTPGPEGYESEPWIAPHAGNFQVRAALPLLNGHGVTAVEELCVSDQTDATQITPEAPTTRVASAELKCESGRPEVVVTLVRPPTRPVLLAVEAASPVAARLVPAGSQESPLRIPLSAGVPDALRLRVLEASGDGSCLAAELPIARRARVSASDRFVVKIEEETPGAPQLRVSLKRDSESPDGTDVLLRLVRLDSSGSLSWIPGTERTEGLRLPLPIAANSRGVRTRGSPADSAALDPPTESFDAGAWAALTCGSTVAVARLPAEEPTHEALLPLPPDPGRYRLHAIERGVHGELRAAEQGFTRSGPARLQLSTVHRALPGDRGFAYLEVEPLNESPTEIVLTVRVTGPLHAGSIRAADAGGAPQAGEAAAEARLTLQPGKRRLLSIPLEPTGPGEARLSVVAQEPSRSSSATASANVSIAEEYAAADGTPDLSIQRRVYLLDRVEQDPADVELEDPHSPVDSVLNWSRRELSSGEPVPPGSLLLIEDEWNHATELAHLRWRQSPASSTVTRTHDLADLRTVGGRVPGDISELEYEAKRLPAGRGHHEFLLVALRPGVSRMPSPRITAEGRAVSVRVEPGEFRLVVRD